MSLPEEATHTPLFIRQEHPVPQFANLRVEGWPHPLTGGTAHPCSQGPFLQPQGRPRSGLGVGGPRGDGDPHHLEPPQGTARATLVLWCGSRAACGWRPVASGHLHVSPGPRRFPTVRVGNAAGIQGSLFERNSDSEKSGAAYHHRAPTTHMALSSEVKQGARRPQRGALRARGSGSFIQLWTPSTSMLCSGGRPSCCLRLAGTRGQAVVTLPLEVNVLAGSSHARSWRQPAGDSPLTLARSFGPLWPPW